jgi:hypothetical protein
MKGWELIALCCSTFLPSLEFAGFLNKHLDEHSANTADPKIAYCAQTCISRNKQILMKGNRRKGPCEGEILGIKKELQQVHFAMLAMVLM